MKADEVGDPLDAVLGRLMRTERLTREHFTALVEVMPRAVSIGAAALETTEREFLALLDSGQLRSVPTMLCMTSYLQSLH